MKINFELEEHEICITPIKVVEALIESGEMVKILGFEGFQNRFDRDELLEIADHLQVYCKYNRLERDEE